MHKSCINTFVIDRTNNKRIYNQLLIKNTRLVAAGNNPPQVDSLKTTLLSIKTYMTSLERKLNHLQ